MIPREKHDAVFQRGDRRMPGADARRTCSCRRDETVHAGVRQEQIVERLQLVSGQLPQPDPGEHGSADLHRSRARSRVPRGISGTPRLQRAAREAPGARIAAGSSSPFTAVLAAVADRGGHGQLRHRGRVSGRERIAFERTCSFRWRDWILTRRRSTTGSRRWSSEAGVRRQRSGSPLHQRADRSRRGRRLARRATR